MAGTKNFTQFDLRTTLLTSDYLVGYKNDGTTELRAPVQSIVDLIGETDSQELTFNETTKDLTITSGNTVSLSSVLDYVEQTVIATGSDTYEPTGARKIKLTTGVSVSGVVLTIDLPRETTDSAKNNDEFYVLIDTLETGSTVQLNRYIWGGSQYIPFTEPVFTFTRVGQSLKLKLIDYVWTIEQATTHGAEHSLNGSDPIYIDQSQVNGLKTVCLALSSGGTINGPISATNITLTNAVINEGESLTSSLSSLVITINNQQYKIPLLAV
jgi:hypothetical protein